MMLDLNPKPPLTPRGSMRLMLSVFKLLSVWFSEGMRLRL